MDKDKLQSMELKDIVAVGERFVVFAKDNPFTLIFLGVGVLIDKLYKDFNKEER